VKILLVGAKGQLGSALQSTLTKHEVIAWGRNELDMTNLDHTRKALEHLHPHLVINAGAYTNVDQAEVEQEAAFRANALGPRNLAVATAAQEIPLVQISTDYVFDGWHGRPYHEFDQPHPLSVYGKSKLAGEEAVRSLNPRHYIVRTAWLYHTDGHNFPHRMCQLAEHGQVRVVSDQYGSPTYAPHLAVSLGRLIETQAFGTYHLAGSGGTSWFEFTRILFHHMKISAQVAPISTAECPRPAPRPRYAVLTTLQEPKIILPSWEEGVADFSRSMR